MPKRKHTSNLKQICLLNIAKNMETYWCIDYKKNFYDQGRFLYVIGPFDGMPPVLLQQLISLLSVLKWMKPYYLHLLIDSSLEHLDLSQCRTVANKDSIVSLITLRCQRLKSLRLSTLNQIPARFLHDLVTALPQLTVLDLKQTRCDDQVLCTIGTSCPNLRDLNLSSCPVTDMGISSLCISFDPQLKKCQRLLRLDLTSTVVTSNGIKCILENLKTLQYLLYPDLCEVLYLMFGKRPVTDSNCLPLRYLSIQQMKATIAPIMPSIVTACQYCPHVTEVHFLRGVDNPGVVALGSLHQLRVLHLANSEEELITFEGGVLPLLQCVGGTIEEISLNEINNLDLGCVAACCSKLKKLQVLIAGYDTAKFLSQSHPELIARQAKMFTNLEDISILLHSPNNDFTAAYLRLLMAESRRLKSVHLAWVDALTDDLLEEILDHNPLSRLGSVKLESCSQVTGEGIWKILHQDNELTSLNLLHCFEITRADFEEYQRFSKEHNFDMSVDWL